MKAVTAGKLNHVSASQITTFKRCARRWYFSKVLNAPEPPKTATELGEQIHKQMERWYELGEIPNHDSARLAVDSGLLPGRDPGVRIEHPRDYGLGLSIAGVPVRGRMDLLVPGSAVEIWDHKSAKSFRYCKTADELRSDVQLNIYGEWAFQNLGCESVKYAHNYLRTEQDNPGFKLVQTEALDREFVKAAVDELEPVVQDMQATAVIGSVDDVPANLDACFDWGGCAFRSICPRLKAESFTELEALITPQSTNETMSLKSALSKAHPAAVNPPDANFYSVQPLGTPAVATVATGTAPPISGSPSTTVAFTGLVLFVDCAPVGYSGPVQNLNALIEPVQTAIATKAKVTDVREIGYGQGTAALVAHFRAQPPSGIVLASSSGLSGLVAEALEGRATLVVRGTR